MNTNFNGSAIHFNCNIHKGSFQAFISKIEKNIKDKHDITFSNVRSCYIAFDQMYNLEYIYICILALSDLKMSVDYYFELKPEKIEKKKEIINKGAMIVENTEQVRKISNDLVKKNMFLIKKMKMLRTQEIKYQSEFFSAKTNYNYEKNKIQDICGDLLKKIKNKNRLYEVCYIYNFIFFPFNF